MTTYKYKSTSFSIYKSRMELTNHYEFLSPTSPWQFFFATFGLGSNLQILIANWKNIPASSTDKEVF